MRKRLAGEVPTPELLQRLSLPLQRVDILGVAGERAVELLQRIREAPLCSEYHYPAIVGRGIGSTLGEGAVESGQRLGMQSARPTAMASHRRHRSP
jgi:hypothetical protein